MGYTCFDFPDVRAAQSPRTRPPPHDFALLPILTHPMSAIYGHLWDRGGTLACSPLATAPTFVAFPYTDETKPGL